MAERNTDLILQKLTVTQQQILDVPEDQLVSYMQIVGETYSPLLFETLGQLPLKVHSLSSFIVRQAEDAMFRFGELHHIGRAVSLGVHVAKLESTRLIYIELETEAIANPPGNDEDFDAFYDIVKLPVAAIEAIKTI